LKQKHKKKVGGEKEKGGQSGKENKDSRMEKYTGGQVKKGQEKRLPNGPTLSH